MAASSATATIISCRLGPPAPPKQDARRPSVSSHALRRACVAAAAACAVMGMAGGGCGDRALALALAWDGDGHGAAAASRPDAVAMGAARAKAKAPPRWSDRRQCPPWRANSLENIVPENLPRPSAHRRFDSFSVSAAEGAAATAPDLVALRPRAGCFSL